MTVPYGLIRDVRIGGRFPYLSGKKVVAITWGDNDGAGLSRAWLAVNGASSLVEWLCEMTAVPLHSQLVSRLGEDEKVLVGHLSRVGHATTGELVRLLRAKDGKRVARRIERRINGAARRTIGRDLVVFRESWFDAEAGERVRDSWWLTRPFEAVGSQEMRPIKLANRGGVGTTIASRTPSGKHRRSG